MKTIFGFVLSFALCGLSPLQANLLTNGSFEADVCSGAFCTTGSLTGWIVAGQVDLINSYWQPAQGQQSLDLNALSPATISQNFATNVGSLYSVSFALAGNPDGGTNLKTLNASAGSTTLPFTFDISGKSKSNMGWIYQNFSFIATQSTSTLSFQSTTTNGAPYGPALDDVSVDAAIPEPATGFLFAGAAAGLALYRRRTR
ncbi:MAG: choice-of-anchor C family protein [Bryobacteraceae bacterium]